MPRRTRPAETERSEHWLRVAVNDVPNRFNAEIIRALRWKGDEVIEWLSPTTADEFAEYYDEAFLERLGLADLRVPLRSFWPAGGPRWDGLARTTDGKVILVEAKAYVEEAVDYRTRASSSESRDQIARALTEAKLAFAANPDSAWDCPFYQYANRLAHLYFLVEKNNVDAYLLFLYFADAPDLRPADRCTVEAWHGAIRLTKKSLGLGEHPYRRRVADIILRADSLLADKPVVRTQAGV